MIARGYITELIPTQKDIEEGYSGWGNTPKARVNIGLFSKPGLISNSIVCEICYPPGIYDAYKVGDFVYIGFVENQIGQPVILGRLYSNEVGNETPQNPRGYMSPQTLCPETSTFPAATTKIGSVTGYDIEQTVERIKGWLGTGTVGGGYQEIPACAVCQSAAINLYGTNISTLGLTSVLVESGTGNYYSIRHGSSEDLTSDQVQNYTELMLGVRIIPKKEDTKFNGVLFWTNGTISYLDTEQNILTNTYKLRMYKATSDPFVTRSGVEEIFEDVANPVSVTDVSTSTTRTSTGVGVSLQSTENGTTTSGTKLTFIDIFDD